MITISFLIRQASNGDPNAIQAFRTFARLLGQFLIPYLECISNGINYYRRWILHKLGIY